ncbi:hypothetical protein SAMN04489722_101411 [Algibacter lectus]|uniref:hypothetical protein n=1 Tax=Algibacter lectus TaxID=221126 RepID=UPI0008E95795|nr:hypothetical protein [Algibacter lectus]SFB99041.1 hypothetical protein SAMN04489722_101411 [Algibacter lectus]
MRVFSSEPEGNELAEAIGADYIKFSISTMDEFNEWLKKSENPAQPTLAIIDMLIITAEKYTVSANLLIKKDKVEEWKTTFYAWYERCNSKIPVKYREGIKQNADELFAELEQYGH